MCTLLKEIGLPNVHCCLPDIIILDVNLLNCSLLHIVVLITSRHGSHREHRSQQYPACLPLRCLAMGL
jgi:hypothetical protein